jgi:hypothetical protein
MFVLNLEELVKGACIYVSEYTCHRMILIYAHILSEYSMHTKTFRSLIIEDNFKIGIEWDVENETLFSNN